MSWDQDYSVPSVESLLEKLTGFNSLELLKEELTCQGLLIKSEEEVLLDEGMYVEVKGTKITLSDGRVFVPKLVKQYTADGNYGCDTYRYVLESETPTVLHIDAEDLECLAKIRDDEDTLLEVGNPPEYDLTDEAPLDSDGELEKGCKCDSCEQDYGCQSSNDEAME